MGSEALVALRRSPLFAMVPPADLCELLGASETIGLDEDAIIHREGDAPDRFYLLLSGEAALIPAPCGIIRLGPGEIVGIEAVLTNCAHANTARAVTQVSAVAIDGEALRAYLEGHFDVTIAMISAMAAYLREQVREITELKMQSTAERLASYLVSLAGDATGRIVVRLPCEKRHLADHLGMDPATLSRAFAKLRDKGVTANRTDKVVITDVAILRSFGECAAIPA
jgi:CRP/FNR family transcriptional activator FtrB